MRKYIAKINIPEELLKESTGYIGEKVFEQWFINNFQGEQLFKQNKDRDFQGIDFVDDKGYKYQVKATREKTYTFNCYLEDIQEHLSSDVYVFVQIKNKVAYIETFRNKKYITNQIKASFKYKNSFIWAIDLQQNVLDI
jgi:hypothetical protein